MKKVTFTAKPSGNKQRPSADDWVQQTPVVEEKMKRLTIDLPDSLHLRVKSQCVLRGTTMVDVVRKFLEREFPADQAAGIVGPKPASKGKK
jgi:hypothetical protein